MAQNYTRQSSFADGDTITAALFNNEFNQIVNAFAYSASSDSSTGHKHDGTSGQGGNIPQIGDIDFLNKIVVDNTNNRWGFYVQVSSGTVEQLRIQDGAIVPVTDNDIDLGTSSLEFKDLFLDGTAHIDTLDVDVNATVAGTLGVTGVITGSSNATIGGTLGVTGAITGSSTLQATTITATTAFVPDASDGASLGTTSLEFSDLYLADGALIAFGDDQDVTLTHVADTGLLLNSTMALQFNDASQYINAPSATVLDINATDEIELNATLVDVNANLDVSGTVTATGTSVFASLDISGDIDVDGTANLDIVDIDGAVNIAATTTVATDNKIQFRDTAIYVNSSTDGQLDIVADTEVQIAATTVDINGAVDISGNLDVGGNLVVTGTTTFNGGTLTLGDAASDNVVFGADVNSNIIPNTDSAFDLGSSTQEWRDLYLDGTAHIDTLDVDVNATIAGTLGVTGVLTGSSLDISGDIDIDGTANLDAVDIDGAVDMASTLAVAGAVTASSTLTAQKLVSTNGILELDDNGTHNGIINSPASLFINIDSDNGATGEDFVIGKDRTGTSGGTELFRVQEDGKLLIGDSASHTSDLLQIETPASGGGHGIQIRRNDSNTSQGIGHILFGNNTDTDLAKLAAGTDGANDAGYLILSTQPTGGSLTDRVTISSTGSVVFNEGGADADFRVESDSNANMIFVDASIDSVGIGTGSPSSTYALDVAGSIRTQGTAPGLTIYETDASNQQWILGGYGGVLSARDVTGGTYPFQIGTGAPTNSIMIQSGGVTINDNSADQDFRVESDSNANALFMDASTSYVGINRSPAVELDVQRISTSYPFRISASDGSARTMVFADSGGSPSRVNWLAGAQYNTDNGWELTPSTANGGYTFTNRVLTAYANGDLTVNENGISADFRVESDGNSHMLFVDGSTNRVGIGASSPNKNVEILASNATLRLEDTASGSKRLDIGVLDTAVAFIDAPQSAQTLKMSISGTESLTQYNNTNGVVFNESGADRDFRVESDNNANVLFVDAGGDCVSIGSSSDKGATLNIEGNVRRGSYTTLSNFNSNNDVLSFGYNIAPSASTVTPQYSGSSSAGGSFIHMESGGGGTLDFRSALHGTDASAFTYTEAGKYLTIRPTAKAQGELVVNQDSNANIDFRVESDTDANALFVDGATGKTTLKELGLGVGGGVNGLGPVTIGTSAVNIVSNGNDVGTLVIVAGNQSGNMFSDLVFYATTVGATVITGGTVSGSPAARTYSVVSSKLKLAMASGSYSVSATALQGAL